MRDSHLHCHPSERGGEASIFHDLACTPGDLLLHLQQKKKQQVPRVANQSASNACCVAAAAPGITVSVLSISILSLSAEPHPSSCVHHRFMVSRKMV